MFACAGVTDSVDLTYPRTTVEPLPREAVGGGFHPEGGSTTQAASWLAVTCILYPLFACRSPPSLPRIPRLRDRCAAPSSSRSTLRPRRWACGCSSPAPLPAPT